MNSNDLSTEDVIINEFVESELTSQLLRLDHEIPIETTPLTTDNQENNQNQLNNLMPTTNGQRYNGSTGSTKTKTKTSVIAGPSSSNGTWVCRAYEAAEYYKKRKEFMLKKVTDEEQRLRKHVAKPMPNFKVIHTKALTTAKETAEACVSPETPEVLRRGLAMKEKQKQKIKDHNLKLSERPPIVARSTKVLKEEPFKPKLAPHQKIVVEPFQLKMNERLKERKEYDQKYQRELAKKKEKDEEQKRLDDARIRQVVREQTTFKARPNPFKKTDKTDKTD